MRIVQITTDSREHFKDYLAPDPYFGAAPQALIEGFTYFPDVEVHIISCSHRCTNVPEKLAENIWFHQPVVGNWGWGKTLYSGCISATHKIIQRINPDVVHGQGTERDCAITSVLSGFPNVITIHGNMAELHRLGYQGHKLYGALAARLENFALSKTHGVLCNSHYTENLVKHRTDKTWLVANPIRKIFFDKSTRTHGPDAPLLLNVGLVNPRKQQVEILRCIREIFHSGTEIKILFAGGLSSHTDYGRTFNHELENAKAEGYADHLGFLNETELVKTMDQCAGFIHFPTEEAFGLVAAEAMARGLTFFGSDVGGIKDITNGLKSAHTYTTLDELKAGLTEWIKSGSQNSSADSSLIEKRYHPKVIAGKHVEIYSQVIKGSE